MVYCAGSYRKKLKGNQGIMDVFTPMLNQMAVLFLFMLTGFVLCKRKLAPDNTGVVLSKLETYIFIPALNINNFMTHFTIENISSRWQSILCSIVLLLLAIGLGFLLSRRFGQDAYSRRIYLYSFVIANFGFMGNAVIQGVFGDDMLFDYLIFTLPMVIFVYTIGLSWITPGASGKLSLKTICSPMFLSLFIGAALGLSGLQMPSFVSTTLSSAAACMSPAAMLLTGFIIGTFDFSSLFKGKRIYFAIFLRLIAIPFLFTGILKLLGVSGSILICALCAYCMPMGLNTVVIPSSYGGDTKLGAGIALISHGLSLITIPVIFAIFT